MTIDWTAVLLIIPFFATGIMYVAGKLFMNNKWKVIHLTAQVTAVFYYIAVSILFKMLFGDYFIGYSLIFFIIILAIHLIVQWKRRTEVILTKALTVLFRFIFLLCFCLYIVLGTVYLYEIFSS